MDQTIAVQTGERSRQRIRALQDSQLRAFAPFGWPQSGQSRASPLAVARRDRAVTKAARQRALQKRQSPSAGPPAGFPHWSQSAPVAVGLLTRTLAAPSRPAPVFAPCRFRGLDLNWEGIAED
jgi:hypothetical protein